MMLSMRKILYQGDRPRIERSMDVSGLFRGQRDVVSSGPLEVKLEAHPENGTVVVDGRLSIDLTLSCSRCLENVREQLHIPFHEIFSPSGEGAEEDDLVHPVSGDQIDLIPYVEQSLMLAIPYIPLCEDACKGLCPVCGQNRNVKECHCKRDPVDPRLAGLADFFRDS